MPRIDDEVLFREFATNLNLEIDDYGRYSGQALLERQHYQLSTLIGLETEFRKLLIKHRSGNRVYRDFISYICDINKNILSARPFFRERHSVFSKKISGALKKRKEKYLYKFRFNYTFIRFVMKNMKLSESSPLTKISRKIEDLRKEIVITNVPLAISHCRIFWGKTPRSHLSFMDLLQIHAGGLLVAVDKFVPPATSRMSRAQVLQAFRKFRSVALGRMTGDRIECFSETLMHFYPVDKRKIYRANKYMRFAKDDNGVVDYAKLVKMVNVDTDPNQRTNATEIANLLASASHVSADTSANDNENEEQDPLVERTASNPEMSLDQIIEESDAMTKVKESITFLSILEQKITRLKGIRNEPERPDFDPEAARIEA